MHQEKELKNPAGCNFIFTFMQEKDKSEYSYFDFDASDFRYFRVRKVCMRSLSAVLVLCLVALANGCAPSKTVHHDVNFDYDVNADFSRLKTYQWVSLPATLRIDEFNRSRIREYANSELEARGLQGDRGQP